MLNQLLKRGETDKNGSCVGVKQSVQLINIFYHVREKFNNILNKIH